MQPPVTKKPLMTHKDCCEAECTELCRLREAAWASQASSGKTGTCEFLDLLLRIHFAMMQLHKGDDCNVARSAAPAQVTQLHDDSRLKTLEASVSNLSDQLRGIGHKLDSLPTQHAAASSEQSGKAKR